MGFTDPARPWVLLGRINGLAEAPLVRAGRELAGGLAGSARAASGARVVPHSLGSILSGLTPSAIAAAITKSLVAGLFRSLLTWVAAGAASLVGVLANALSATTQPVLTGSAFSSEFELMAALSAAVALPLVALAAIQAIVRQEPGSLLRSVLIRLPLALLFTGVSVQLVALGLVATDQASALLIGADGDPTHQMLSGLITGLAQPGNFGLAAFGGFLVVGTAAVVAFVLWLELAVRSAAIAAAALFLPLALVGLAWPATSHWARRLGETLAALVLSKLVIAAVLALAAGLLVDPSGIAGVVEGVALLAIGAFAPFALLKLVPVIEAGAVGHLEGLGRRPLQAMERLGRDLGLEGGGVAALAGLGGILTLPQRRRRRRSERADDRAGHRRVLDHVPAHVPGISGRCGGGVGRRSGPSSIRRLRFSGPERGRGLVFTGRAGHRGVGFAPRRRRHSFSAESHFARRQRHGLPGCGRFGWLGGADCPNSSKYSAGGCPRILCLARLQRSGRAFPCGVANGAESAGS